MRKLAAWITIALCLSAVPQIASAARSVGVPRDLDGAIARYVFNFERESLVPAARSDGAGALTLAVRGAEEISDAAGRRRRARTYHVDARGLADMATQQWQDLDGSLVYALDPPSGALVQARLDAELAWTSVSNPRLRYETTMNTVGLLRDSPDTLAQVVRLLDALGGRRYSEGERITGGPGPALFAEVGSPIAPAKGGAQLDPVAPVETLPLRFVLRATGDLEVSGTAYLQDGASLPAGLTLRYFDLSHARSLGTLKMARVDGTEGGKLPDLPAFVHPSSNPGAETAPPFATGTRRPSWATEPAVEHAIELSEATPEVRDYRAAHPGAFVSVVLDFASTSEAAPLGAVSPGLRSAVDHARSAPSWQIFWYADDDPGIQIHSVVYPDALGQFQAASEVGTGFASPIHPARTLTTSSVFDLLEGYVPPLRDDGSSVATVVYLADPHLWIEMRGPGVDAAAIAADPRRLLDHVHPMLPQACASGPPDPGSAGILDGAGGVLLGAISAHYVSPHVATPQETASCAEWTAGVDIAGVTATLPAEAAARAGEAASYADPSHLPHAPIAISSDADLAGPAVVSGVVGGSGTADDPFRIAGWNIASGQDPAISISNTTKHVLVSGNLLHGLSTGVSAQKVRNLRVEGNRLTGLDRGITILGLSHGRISGNVAVGVTEGIHVQNYLTFGKVAIAAIPVTDLEVSGNEVHASGAGITYYGTYGSVRDNSFRDNVLAGGSVGLYAERVTDTEIKGNRFEDNEVGLWLAGGGSRIEVSGGFAVRPARTGIMLDGARGPTISGVEVRDAAGYGLLALGGASANISGSRFVDGTRGLVALRESDLTIEGSVLAGNADFGVYQSASTVDARSNWWGATDGPAGCASGSGDRVACGVGYEPFLTASPS